MPGLQNLYAAFHYFLHWRWKLAWAFNRVVYHISIKFLYYVRFHRGNYTPGELGVHDLLFRALVVVWTRVSGAWKRGRLKPHATASFIQSFRQVTLWGLRRVAWGSMHHKDKPHMTKTCHIDICITSAEVTEFFPLYLGGAWYHIPQTIPWFLRNWHHKTLVLFA